MPDFEKMYAILCAAASEAVDLLPDDPACNMARMTLLDALHGAEELYKRGKTDPIPGGKREKARRVTGYISPSGFVVAA